jgi:hypothetical protein
MGCWPYNSAQQQVDRGAGTNVYWVLLAAGRRPNLERILKNWGENGYLAARKYWNLCNGGRECAMHGLEPGGLRLVLRPGAGAFGAACGSPSRNHIAKQTLEAMHSGAAAESAEAGLALHVRGSGPERRASPCCWRAAAAARWRGAALLQRGWPLGCPPRLSG